MRNHTARGRILACLVASGVAGVGACITVNIYFPAPEVRAAAEDIVEETWGNLEQAPSADAAEPSSSLERSRGSTGSSVTAWFGPAEAWAQQADINVSTAAIRSLKAAMKERSVKLKPYLTAGRIGLDKRGMLVVRDLAGLSLKEQAELRRLVEAEGRDRRSLYKEIANANHFGDDRVDDIQAIFAETWRKKAETGWWVQNPDGVWVRR